MKQLTEFSKNAMTCVEQFVFPTPDHAPNIDPTPTVSIMWVGVYV